MSDQTQKTSTLDSTRCPICGGEGWLRFDPPDSQMCHRCCGTGRIQEPRRVPRPTTTEELLSICDMSRKEWDQLGEDLRTGKETLDTSWIE